MLTLFTYFMIAGAALLWALSLLNSVLDPSGPKPSVVAETPEVFVKRDSRTEEAAQQATTRGETLKPPPEAVVPVTQDAEPVTPVPIQVSGPAPVTPATSADDAAARAEHLARNKIKAERARKQRLARERARAQEQAAASRQQKQLQYGDAAQPTFGLFGGWGQPQR